MRQCLLLIGGSSSVGKTTVARSLASRLDWDLVQTDTILAAEHALNPLAGLIDLWDRPPQELCEKLVAAASASMSHLIEYAAKRSRVREGVIFEGERIHPKLVARLAQLEDVAAGFIIESDARRIYETLMKRSGTFRMLTESRRRTVAEVDRLYGSWLFQESSYLGVACIASQPWDTLEQRLLDTCAVQLRLAADEDFASVQPSPLKP